MRTLIVGLLVLVLGSDRERASRATGRADAAAAAAQPMQPQPYAAAVDAAEALPAAAPMQVQLTVDEQ